MLGQIGCTLMIFAGVLASHHLAEAVVMAVQATGLIA